MIIICRVGDPVSQSLMMKSSGSWELRGETHSNKKEKNSNKTNQNERNPEVLVNLTSKSGSGGGGGREVSVYYAVRQVKFQVAPEVAEAAGPARDSQGGERENA